MIINNEANRKSKFNYAKSKSNPDEFKSDAIQKIKIN